MKSYRYGLVLLVFLISPSFCFAQTYTWDRQAFGQFYQQCPNLNPQYWPSNNFWSQALQMNSGCTPGSSVVSQPSNWSPAPPAGTYPTGPGISVIVGSNSPALLDTPVTVDSFTLLTNGVLFINSAGALTATTIDFQRDGAIGNVASSGGNDYINIAPGGTLTKSGGTGTFGFGDPALPDVGLYGSGYNIVVKSGSLALPFGGRGLLFNGLLAVSNGTSVVLAPDASARRIIAGTFAGVGQGHVVFDNGSVWAGGYDLNLVYHNGLTLDFPGDMFQWSGGNFQSGSGVTNINVVNVSSNAATINGIAFYNYGSLHLASNSALNLLGGELDNESAGTIDIQGDADIMGGGVLFYNYGLLRKSAGPGSSTIVPRFNNNGGTVEVDSGILALNTAGSGGFITNASFIVHPGATLSLSSVAIYSTEIAGHLRGSGGGTVLLADGTVQCNRGGTLDFPDDMFQWSGGYLGANAPILTNLGNIHIVGTVGMLGVFLENAGRIIQSGLGGIGHHSGILDVTPTGIYEVQNDQGILLAAFNNRGALEKTAGSGTTTVEGVFHNSGTIAPTSGVFLFTTNFYQDAGTLPLSPGIRFGTNQTFYLTGGRVSGSGLLGHFGPNSSVRATGGTLAPDFASVLAVPAGGGISFAGGASLAVVLAAADQFSHLIVSNSVVLGGHLSVALANGYAPAPGVKFQIISSAKLSGTFASTDIPQGISVTYQTNGVLLTVTGAVPIQATGSHLSGTNFGFAFPTIAAQSYTIQRNTDLATTNWVFYSKVVGTGSVYSFLTPVTNVPHAFFRVRSP